MKKEAVTKTTVNAAKKTAAGTNAVKAVKKADVVSAKKTASVKKAVPVKTAAVKAATPARKAVTAKKAAATMKAVPVKKAAPAKKAAAKKAAVPAKKAAAIVKKAEPVKKAAAIVKKAEPVKKAAATVKKAEPVKKAAATVKKAEPVKKAVSQHRKNKLSASQKKHYIALLKDLRRTFSSQLRFHQDEALTTKKDSAGERAGMATHMADLGSDNFRHDLELGLMTEEGDVLEMIEEALLKIENDEYGICGDCECLINPERLEAKPYARYCVRCKDLREKMEEPYHRHR